MLQEKHADGYEETCYRGIYCYREETKVCVLKLPPDGMSCGDRKVESNKKTDIFIEGFVCLEQQKSSFLFVQKCSNDIFSHCFLFLFIHLQTEIQHWSWSKVMILAISYIHNRYREDCNIKLKLYITAGAYCTCG